MNTSDLSASDTFPPPMATAPSRPSTSAHTLEVIMVLGYGMMCLLCLALIAHLRHNRSDALKGNSSAARRIILPAFEPLLWILCATTGAFAIALFIMLVFKLFEAGLPKLVTEGFYCGRQFVFLLVMVFMHQKSVSLPALRRCVLISLALATYTLPSVVYTTYWGNAAYADTYFQIQRALRLLLVAWYVFIFVYPPSRASKRSIREFCGFTFGYQAFSLTATEVFRAGYYDTGYTLTNCALLWAALCPLVIWRVLRADTEHWRGVGHRACAFQSVYRQRHQIHEHISSQGLHVLIEMHRKLIIDFAYLQLRVKIGTGASAIVYDGLLHSRTPVAAKVYTPLALTDDVVASFSQEAALCGALNHPNIVAFYGMCVCPPTICLVFELCQGSLETVLHTNTANNVSNNSRRQRLSIAVGYMIDAARAVAYMHSFEPSLLHRDIKPANFLVDSEHNVKLADFGESRSVSTKDDTIDSPHSATALGEHDDTFAPVLSGVVVPSPTVLEMREMAQKMTVKGTVDYMAPELINGKGGFACYGEAADVYSLAMTMWDILHAGEERYPGCSSNHLHVFQAVLDGKRPELASDVHPALREVISRAWDVDPRRRPSAQDIVGMLEIVQEEVSAAFLLDGFEDFGIDSVALLVSETDDEDDDHHEAVTHRSVTGKSGGRNAGTPGATFSGVEAVEHLLANEHVASIGEALRMGRMWLDAGFLHHIKHAQGFTFDAARFYLDEDYIRLCQPIATGGLARSTGPPASTRPPSCLGGGRTHSASAGDTIPRRGGGLKSETNVSTFAGRTPACACRQHGQRQIHEVKPSRRQRFKRKQKFPTITEANLLTASLLTPHETTRSGSGPNSGEPGFVDFEWHVSSDFNALRE